MESIRAQAINLCYSAMARVAPTAMIFVPCVDGISHNEIESATPEHREAGGNVLLRAMPAVE